MATKDYTAKIKEARENGFSDADIIAYLSTIDPKIKVAVDEGYTNEEIIGYLSSAPVEARDVPVTTKKPAKPEPDRSAAQLAGVTSSALLPYATAAGLGAAAGAPFAGIGAPFGAAAGVASLGIGDLATGAYNIAAPMFGGERVPLPSETIRAMYENVGIGRRPQTPEQEVLFRTVEGAGGAFGGASALNTLARTAQPGVVRNVMQELGRGRGVQTAAGAGAAAAPTIASEYAGVENPLALFGLSLGGGMVGGRMATPRATTVTGEQLAQQADIAYKRANAAGVYFDPAAIASLAQDIRSAMSTPTMMFHRGLHPRINVVLEDLDATVANAQKTGAPISFSELELLRRLARTAARSADADERRLGAGVIRQIDDFVQAPPPNAILGGDAPTAASAIKEARTAWRRMSQGDAIEDMIIQKATDTAEGLSANTIRAAARSINRSETKKNYFDPDIQKQIKDLGRGSGGLKALQTVGMFGPTIPKTVPQAIRALPGAATLTGTGAAAYSGSPWLTALGIGAAGTGLTSQAIANRMALSRVNQMASQARGAPPRDMFKKQIASQVVQQAPRVEAMDDEYEYYYDENGNLLGARLKQPPMAVPR